MVVSKMIILLYYPPAPSQQSLASPRLMERTLGATVPLNKTLERRRSTFNSYKYLLSKEE
jgi:hypothetical protein